MGVEDTSAKQQVGRLSRDPLEPPDESVIDALATELIHQLVVVDRTFNLEGVTRVTDVAFPVIAASTRVVGLGKVRVSVTKRTHLRQKTARSITNWAPVPH